MQSGTYETSSPHRLVEHPRVSVLMITYNHAKYLAEAIESVVRQACNFPFELIIGEDASKDETLQVAIEYQKRYPEIVRVIHSPTNIGMNANSLRIFERARGEYVAYCEGDDFWCARDKLARQVALMEQDARIGIVHTDWTHARLQRGQWVIDGGRSAHRRVPMKYLAGDLFQTWYLPKILRTCTILLKRSTLREFYRSGLMDLTYPFGDAVLTAWITSGFRIGYVPAITAVYRVSPNSALRSGAKSRVNFYQASLRFDNAARAFFTGIRHYSQGYRWESTAALLVWGLRARDLLAMDVAIREFGCHFTIRQFLVNGFKSIRMRLPTPARQVRDLPDQSSAGARRG
jgi:glycosyltransferase involved in cell wall biosynthesis